MRVLRKSEVHLGQSTDSLWWGLAALLGLVSLWLPQLLQTGADRTTQLLVAQSALFFSGGLIGSLRPDRVWRWGAACLLAFTLRDLTQFANDSRFLHATNGEVLAYLAGNASLYALHTIPVLAGAYLGAFMIRGGQK
ncbi:MAG: hypothetical protein ABSH05_20845 [Bryobacteraceae bacterium]|jgi:hypothetical protein